MDDRVWDASTSHNRERLLAGEVAQEFLAALVSLPEVKALMSHEHSSVDADRRLGLSQKLREEGR